MEKPASPLETFSALSLMEYIRLMTAALLVDRDDKSLVQFKISVENYNKMLAEPLHTPLLGLHLDYDEKNATLTVTPEDIFLPQYSNKIMKEVVLTFSENYKNRYKNWLTVLEE